MIFPRSSHLDETVNYRSQLSWICAEFKADESEFITFLTVDVGQSSIHQDLYLPGIILYFIQNDVLTQHVFLQKKSNALLLRTGSDFHIYEKHRLWVYTFVSDRGPEGGVKNSLKYFVQRILLMSVRISTSHH